MGASSKRGIAEAGIQAERGFYALARSGGRAIFASLNIARRKQIVIVLDLECAHAHRFEGWFACAEVFSAQSASGMLTCPVCGDANIRRCLSAPHVARRQENLPAAGTPDADRLLAKLVEVLRDQAVESEDVGSRFAEEARRIHHGESEERAIRGLASFDEARSLLEEGISVLPLPSAKEDLH